MPPPGKRVLAYAQLRAGRPAEALETIIAGATRSYPAGRFAGVDRILAEDVGLIAAAYARAQPDKRSRIEQRLSGIGARIASEPSLRFVLTWETDANDVDFHIYDGRGGHAFYGSRALQFDHFPLSGDLKGATGILVLSDQAQSRLNPARVAPYFDTLEKVDTIETRGFGRRTRRVEIWRGTGYKGHPRLDGPQGPAGDDPEPESE